MASAVRGAAFVHGGSVRTGRFGAGLGLESSKIDPNGLTAGAPLSRRTGRAQGQGEVAAQAAAGVQP
jgi:hypothetical protein